MVGFFSLLGQRSVVVLFFAVLPGPHMTRSHVTFIERCTMRKLIETWFRRQGQ